MVTVLCAVKSYIKCFSNFSTPTVINPKNTAVIWRKYSSCYKKKLSFIVLRLKHALHIYTCQGLGNDFKLYFLARFFLLSNGNTLSDHTHFLHSSYEFLMQKKKKKQYDSRSA